MKRISLIVMAMALALTLIPCGVFAADSEINVTIDGKAVVWTDAAPYIDENNRTMVPLRAIGEAMGLTVNWDQKTKEAIFSKTFDEATAVALEAVADTNADQKNDAYVAGVAIAFPVASKTAQTSIYMYAIGGDGKTVVATNEEPQEMDTAAVMKDARTYAPVKYLAEFFEYKVDWDQKTKTVVITSTPAADAGQTTPGAVTTTPDAITTTPDAIKKN